MILPCPLCDRRTEEEPTEATAEEGFPEEGSFEQPGVEVVEGLLENVLCIQRHISNTFRNGQRLHDVIQRLKNGEVDPMKDDWLVLRISKATWYDRSSGQHVTRYYTYDHRRLYCMWMAGCSKVRARIELNCPAFSELARKAHRLGTRLEPLAFKCWCCVLSVELHHRV